MQVWEKVDLRPLTTLCVNQQAQKLLILEKENDYPQLKQYLTETPSYYFLGNGSKVVFVGDYKGTLIQNRIKGVKICGMEKGKVRLQVAAGTDWSQLVAWTVKQNWFGLENLALIPGSAGAAAVQNISAYGQSLDQVLLGVRVYDLEKDCFSYLSRSSCQLQYRHSFFKTAQGKKLLITDLFLQLSLKPLFKDYTFNLEGKETSLAQELKKRKKYPPFSSAAVWRLIVQLRRQRLPDPRQIPNAGCTFVNPTISPLFYRELKKEIPQLKGFLQKDGQIRIPAAQLLDHLGLRGYRQGNVGLYAHHAQILITNGKAKGEEILSFIRFLQTQVQKRLGVSLVPELNVVGNLDF